jgi:spore germination protein
MTINRRKLRNFSIGVTVALAIALGIHFWTNSRPLTSPLTLESTFRFLNGEVESSTSSKVVYGFLPYWNLNKFTPQPELTHLGYFGLPITGEGTIYTDTDVQPEAIGYHRLDSEELTAQLDRLSKSNTQFAIALTQFNNDDIAQLANSPRSQQELLKTLDSLLLAYPIADVNLDFEYSGAITPQLRENFAKMVGTVSQHVHDKYDGVTVSIDMYASASTHQLIWDVPQIGKSVDYIIIMAYDFHQRSSIVAGPVAPIFGGKEQWDSDISQQLKAFVQAVPPRKLLLGVPFYGYEWQTTSNDPRAHTFPDTGRTASFDRVQKLLADSDAKVTTNWNEFALSPYLTYVEDGKNYVLYYENSRSISYKLDFVNQLDLGGIAIWALGYEGDSRELWDVIERKIAPTDTPAPPIL